MQENSLGEIIRTLRKQAGMTQEELADGICSPVSISRIESGKQMPSGRVLDELLTRLGTGTYQICNIYYKNEKQTAFEDRANRVKRLVSEGKLKEARKSLESLKDEADEHMQNKQLCLLLESSIMLYEQKNPTGILEKLDKAIRITKSEINYQDFRTMLFSVAEANILSIMVVALYRAGKILEAIKLGEEFMTALNRQKSTLSEYLVIRINLAFNLAQCLEQEKRYKEALKYAIEAEELSLNSTEQMLLPEIEFIKAKALHLTGDDESCRAILKSIVPYMELIKKTDFADLVRNYAKRELKLTIK